MRRRSLRLAVGQHRLVHGTRDAYSHALSCVSKKLAHARNLNAARTAQECHGAGHAQRLQQGLHLSQSLR